MRTIDEIIEYLEDQIEEQFYEDSEEADHNLSQLIPLLNALRTARSEMPAEELEDRLFSMAKSLAFIDITAELFETYTRKNHDYGDSFGRSFHNLGLMSAIVRISDKTNRLISLATKEAKVEDETIEDTLADLANYCIMTLIELRIRKEGAEDEQ